jgi:hypothetical protein
MFWRGSSVVEDLGELGRRRRRLACERLERNCVSDGLVIGIVRCDSTKNAFDYGRSFSHNFDGFPDEGLCHLQSVGWMQEERSNQIILCRAAAAFHHQGRTWQGLFGSDADRACSSRGGTVQVPYLQLPSIVVHSCLSSATSILQSPKMHSISLTITLMQT